MPGEIVVVGTSRGGLKASQVLLSGLEPNFPVPVVIVQHRGKDESSLCDYLNRTSPLPVSEPEDKELILPGHVYLAPRDYHLPSPHSISSGPSRRTTSRIGSG